MIKYSSAVDLKQLTDMYRLSKTFAINDDSVCPGHWGPIVTNSNDLKSITIDDITDNLLNMSFSRTFGSCWIFRKLSRDKDVQLFSNISRHSVYYFLTISQYISYFRNPNSIIYIIISKLISDQQYIYIYKKLPNFKFNNKGRYSYPMSGKYNYKDI